MRRFFIALLALSFPHWALADSDIIKIPSQFNVSQTMDRFEQLVEEKGMAVFARVDHEQNAHQAGMKMKPSQVLIFGNPRLGTNIMLKDPAAALDLPLRVAVYQDADGKVWLAYHDPLQLQSTYQLEGLPALQKASGAMAKFSKAATE